MCLPNCLPTVARRMRDEPPRRRFLKAAALAPVAAVPALSPLSPAALAQNADGGRRVVDLTHVFTPEFPTFYNGTGITVNILASGSYNSQEWLVNEHAGTHMDAPLHFSENGLSADQIPPEQLVSPLAVVDIREKSHANPDAQLTPDDLRRWESANGEIPQGAVVAMLSGWAEFVHSKKFRNADDDGTMHFPGFHPEAAEFMMTERNVVGMAVDTLSLDHGPSADFPVHYDWLPTGRWGLECVAEMHQLPPVGATIFVGSPKVRGATGGQTRILALV